MRILLDESLPIELRSEIASHEVHYVREMGATTPVASAAH